jgi:NADPH:quinone reductase-like Zn-dependent oxidoreductase
VRVKAAAINPGEASIRRGLMHERWPATFPSGQGSDLAGVVAAVGPDVGTPAPGDEVLGWTDARAAQAEEVVVPAAQLVPKPAAVPWEVAGTLYVAGSTAWAATRAVGAGAGDTVAVSGAAGGVGSITVQLARLAGARVIGLASEANHDWLRAHGVEPLTYGDGLRERLPRLDAFIDTFGGGYVELALDLGVAPERVGTIIDFAAAQRHPGVRTDGNAVGASPDVLRELAALIAGGELEVPIAATFPLDRVRDAYALLERRHTRGKIVLIP